MSATANKTELEHEIDEAFDNGEDMRKYFDFSKAEVVKPENETRRVNINMPVWLIEAIDKEASHVGANRQSYINIMLAEGLKHTA